MQSEEGAQGRIVLSPKRISGSALERNFAGSTGPDPVLRRRYIVPSVRVLTLLLSTAGKTFTTPKEGLPFSGPS